MKLEIKNYKAVRGHDGQGFNVTLYIDGTKAAFVDDDGYGGGFNYTWFNQNLRTAFEQYVKTLPPTKCEGFPDGLEMDADIVIGDLVNKIETEKLLEKERKRLVKKCATNTVYVLSNDGKYYTINRPFTPQERERIMMNRPTAKFLNEHLEDGDWVKLLGFPRK